jgi:xanthine dehydrogenase YagS FAD-binding subunit
MNSFSYTRADEVGTAVAELAENHGARFIAGGTNLLDLMKENVEHPNRLIDVTHLPLKNIELIQNGGLRIGALVTNTDVAYDERIENRYPLLSKAILAGASQQLRNMATTGGNLLQRTRCCYFYDITTPCNKREPGTGCSAIDGFNRGHAVLGASEHCIAVFPSDMCVAMAVLEASINVTGKRGGARTIPFSEFHRLPGDTPHIDNNLRADEIITSVDLPAKGFARHNCYLKVRDRTSYAFALVSVAVGLELEGQQVREARLALGGVAHKPWRDKESEAWLNGKAATRENFQKVAEAVMREARGFRFNNFKIELAKRAIVRALEQAAAGTPPPNGAYRGS